MHKYKVILIVRTKETDMGEVGPEQIVERIKNEIDSEEYGVEIDDDVQVDEMEE